MTRQEVMRRIRVRYYRALDYLSIIAFTLVIYGAAVLADYLVFEGVLFLLERSSRDSPLARSVLDSLKVGAALVGMALAAIHALRSARSQWKLDNELAQE